MKHFYPLENFSLFSGIYRTARRIGKDFIAPGFFQSINLKVIEIQTILIIDKAGEEH